MNEDKLQKFYKNAKDLNPTFTMDYDAFKVNMQDNEKRSKFYNNVRKLNPEFTMTDEEADAVLGFVSEQSNEDNKQGGFFQRIFGNTQQAQMYARQAEEAKEAEAEEKKKQENYHTAGMTEQDQQDIAALEQVEQKNPLLGYSKASPVDISEETEQILNKKSQMSSYIQRGEDPSTIHINAFERALNTDEGKNYYNTLLNEAVNEFVNSDEHKALLEQYKLGQVSEEEINKAFSDKYEEQINKKFAEKMLAKGTPLGDYIEIAERKFYTKQGASDAMELEGKIDAALEQLEQETNDNFREDYKKIYGVYPEDDKDAKYRVHTISGQYEGKRAMLSNAQKFNKEALTLINAVSRKEEFGDFWRGVGNAAADLDTWDLGIGELLRNVELLDVIKKLEYNETAPADKQMEITESEQMMLDAALNFFTVSAYYSEELGRGYKAGQTSMASMPFMLEFVLSAGTMTAIDASVKGTARAGAAILVKQMRKRGMQKLANATTGKVSHMVGSMASGIVSSAINAAYMTGVYGTARIAGGTVERMTGQVKPEWDSENKKFVYGGREGAQEVGEALWNSAAETYIENLSEMVLAKTLDPMRAFVRGTDVFKKVAKSDLIGAISSIRNNPTFRSLRQATQFGGYFEEVAEEYLGGILRRVAMTDVNNWQQAGLDLDGQIDIFLGLAPTSILFGTTGAASYYGGIAYNSKRLKESMSSDAQRQMFDQLMEESRSGEFKEGAHDFIRGVLLDGNISEEKKMDIIMGVVKEYQSVLSKKLQEQANDVATTEFEKEIDKFIDHGRLSGTESIITSTDEQGRAFVIVDGSVEIKEETVDGNVVRTIDSGKSSREVQVRYLKNDGTLSEDIVSLRTNGLNMPIEEISTETFKGLKLAQYRASFASLDTFEYEDGIYDTKTGLFIRTKEEQEQIDASEQQIEEVVQQPTGAPTINTKPRIIVNEEYKVTVNGQLVNVRLTSIASSPMIQREDGSIQSGDFVVTVDGKAIRNKDAKKDYINAVSEKLKADHAKAVEEYNKKKAEEAAANVVEPQPLISEEDRVARTIEQERQAKEVERQAILANIQQNKTKQGEIQMDKLTPEETLLVYQNEETSESLMQLLTEQLQYLRSQVAEIQEKDLSPIEKKNKTRKIQQSISSYEAAIEKWLGAEALATINAEPEVVHSVVPPTQEAAVEPVEEPTNPDTTPLPLAEPEIEGTEVAEDETPAPETLGEETVPEVEQEIAGNESVESEPVVEKPTANLDEVTVWVAKNYDYIVTDKEGNTIFSSKPTRKNVTDAFEELHQVDGKVDGKRGTYNGEDCIIVRDNPAKGYVNIVTPHGIERVGREEVMVDGKPLKGKASIVEWRENNEKMYDTFESIMSFPVFDIRGEMNITFLDFLNTRQDSPYVAFYDMLRKHYREKYNDDVAQQYLDASVSRLIENLKEVARLWNIVRLKNLVSSGQMPTALDKKKMESQSQRIKEAVAAVHNEVGLDNSITFSGLAKLSEKAAKKAEKKGEGEGYFAETDEEKAESYVDGLVSNIVWIGFETENKREHKDAVDGIIEALNKESKKASKQRELVVNILNNRYEEAKRLNRLNDIQAIERVIDRLSSLKKFKSLLTEAGLIEEKRKKAPVKPAPKKDTSKLVEQLSLEENSLRDMEEEYKTTTDAEEKSELEGYIAQAKEKIAKLKAEIDGAEFMVGNVAESSASNEARELSLAAEMQSLTDNEEIEVINVTAEQAEEARRTGKGEMQVSNETQRIFVSNAERAVESIKQEKATPQQWKAMIEKQGGLKAGEDKWLGLSEWLDNQEKKTLTRQEILDFISENQILIVELDYADASSLSEDDILNSEYFSMLVDELLDWSEDEPVIDMDKYHEYQEDPDFVDGFGTDYWNETLIVRDPAKAAKYLGIANPIHSIRLRYTTEELDEKKEIAIVVPTIDSYNETDNIHFGDAGNGRAVAWIRFGETTDESGNRVLVIDEIQSKRHQDGRDKGYSNTIELRKKIEEAKQKIADINAKSTNNVQRIDELISEIKELRKDNEEKEDAERYELARLREEQDNVRNNRDYDRLQAEIDEISETQLKRLNHISKLNTELRLLQDRALDSASSDEVFDLRVEIQNYELELLNKVPDAPFDKNWHELAFKRMLRYAAENGFDYVAWTTGTQQAERYDLGHTVNRIVSANKKNSSKDIDIEFTNGGGVTLRVNSEGVITSGEFSGKTLSDVVGKDIADKIINNEGDDVMFETSYGEIPAKELKGENLSIGGEGMKGFYDKMLPSFVSKYTKKWGAKVQDINLPELEASAHTMHAVNVTPEMKESVMQGQPMFSIESTPLMTSKGVIYGYALGNKIYLTPDGMNTNTPVHEYTHIWAKAMQKHNPKAWKSIVEQLKKAEALWNDVINDPNYENIKNDEDAVASEVLSRYSGKNGAIKLEAEAELVVTEYKGMEKGLKVKALISRVKKALEKFWSWVGKDLFKIESFESVESIADRVLYDMLNNTQLNLDNSKKSSTFAENNENYERTDEFRELQERSLGLSQSRISEFRSGERKLSDEDRRRVGGVFQRLMESERNGGRNGQWINLTGKGNQFKIAQVNPAIFHDIFQICRNYLPNGELVDLHDNYADCKCFISEDGLCGFAIEPNGNLISVFSLNPSDKNGFLYAIKDLIRQEGATHLDCFVSNKQPLSEIYQKVLGFHVASEMDYNMEYDHDNIAENHGMPKVAFMVDKPTEKREFDGDSYDAAYDYQLSQTSTAEREQIITEAKANGTYMMHNGQPTNLTEDQWVTVRTQAFKDYFGDWINDKDNASVVLDENGEPLVTYHGSRMAGFDKFGRGEARDSQGIYTTPNRRAAESYATSIDEWRSEQAMPEAELGVPDHHGVYSLFVNMRNPKVIDFGGNRFDRYGTPQYEVATNEVLDNGGRGILFDTLEEAKAYMAAHPEEDLDYVEKYTTSDDMLVQAKEEGYDGVIFTNIIDSRYQDPITNYVPFESNQVKSATQNIGTFNPQDDRIEFMIGPNPTTSSNTTQTPSGYDQRDGMTIDAEVAARLQVKSKDYMAALANPKAQLPDELSRMNEWVAKLLDRTEGIRVIMEKIRKFRQENDLPPMSEGFDVRTMIEAMDSKIANETKLFVMTKENELRKAIYKLAKRIEKSDFYKKYKYEKELKQDGKKSKLTPREIIERYLIACDSIEREELKGNPRGAGDFLKRMGVDMIQYRQEFLEAFANTQEGIDEINHLWETIRGVTDMVISEGERSGLISQEEAISYKRRRFYVPERDFAEVEANEELQVKDAGYGSGRMGNKLMATQEAEGGMTLAANVLANMTLLARDAIVKANKNIVKVAMFDLLRANEEWCKANNVPVPRQVWFRRNPDGSVTRVTDGPTAPEKKIMRDLKSQIRDRENEIIQERMLAESAADAATRQAHMDVIAEIEEEIESLRQANPFLDEFDARDMMFLSRHTQKESTVTVFVDGIPCEMHFPNMTIVANALNGTTNKKFAAEGLKKLTSALSATMTVYNPAFFTVNVVRDIPFILAKGYAEYGWQFPVRFAAKLMTIPFSGIWKAVAGNYKGVNNPHIREFFEGGGNTGYSTIPDIDKLKSATKRWDRRRSDIGMQDIGDVISYMNTFSEVWTRLAAYSVVRDMGGTKEDGVRAAKNLSVNFNRKGLGAPIWDAFMNMSFFANAALQGASGFYRTFKGNKDTAAKNVLVGFRAANAFLVTPMFAGFISTLLHPDDDDELLWITDWDRDNYWYIGDSGFRIAINEQIKPAWVIGVNIALGMKGRRTKEQISNSIISSVFTNWLTAPQNVNSALTMAVNNHYGTKGYSNAQIVENLFVPQAMQSFSDIANNVDFMGYKIKNESGDLPSYMSNENSALLYKMVAEFLYEANGGDKDLHSKHIEVMNEDGTIEYQKMSDLYDKSPKEINTILSVFVGSTWKDLGNAIAEANTDGEFVPTNYQTIKRFYKPTEKEMTILSIMREARGITRDYTEQYNNYINQIAGSGVDVNTEKRRKARERIVNLIGKEEERGEKHLLMILVNAYDANTMYSHAKQFGMNETKFKESLKENNPDLYDAFDKYNGTKREELVRKILTLTRDIKDMEMKDNPIIHKTEDFLGVNE